MNNSKKRHCGSAYRRFETMMNYYAKPGKDRTNVQKFVLHPWDYSGEKYAMVDGKRKLIYRTYQTDPDTLELYAATKRGIT